MKEVKPCPFCGNDDIIAWAKQGKYNGFCYLECDVCGAKTKAYEYLSSMSGGVNMDDSGIRRCVNAWNRRV